VPLAELEETGPAFCLPVINTRHGEKKALPPELGVAHGGISGPILRPTSTDGIYFWIGCFDVIGDDGEKLGKEYCNSEPCRRLFPPVAPEIIILE
jgi:hypothetical protein